MVLVPSGLLKLHLWSWSQVVLLKFFYGPAPKWRLWCSSAQIFSYGPGSNWSFAQICIYGNYGSGS